MQKTEIELKLFETWECFKLLVGGFKGALDLAFEGHVVHC